jgi:hypothetical protein
MRSPQTLARSVARCRGSRRAARYCGLMPTLYHLTWTEKEEMEDATETEETEEITINCF